MVQKKFTGLVLLLLFLVLQAGNMMSYVLCPVAMTTETSVKDCGCDRIFNAFNSDTDAEGQVKQASFKSMNGDTMPPDVFGSFKALSFALTGYHASYQLYLPQDDGPAVFHPPAV